MPLIFQQDITNTTKVGLWQINENEDFFSDSNNSYSIKHPQKRIQSLAGRNLITNLENSFPLSEIQILPSGKPVLINGEFHFSISHCRNFAAAIVSSTQIVGIDVELVTPRILKLKDKFISSYEEDIISKINHSNEIIYTICWSVKEAMFKWYGLGNVDFKKNLEIESLNIKQGAITGTCFVNKEQKIKLFIEGKIFNDIILVWTLDTKPQ